MYCSVSFRVYQCHVSQEVLNFDTGKWGQRLFMCILVIKFTGAVSCCSGSGLYYSFTVTEDLWERQESWKNLLVQYLDSISAKKFCSLMGNKDLYCIVPPKSRLFSHDSGWKASVSALSICFVYLKSFQSEATQVLDYWLKHQNL